MALVAKLVARFNMIPAEGRWNDPQQVLYNSCRMLRWPLRRLDQNFVANMMKGEGLIEQVAKRELLRHRSS